MCICKLCNDITKKKPQDFCALCPVTGWYGMINGKVCGLRLRPHKIRQGVAGQYKRGSAWLIGTRTTEFNSGDQTESDKCCLTWLRRDASYIISFQSVVSQKLFSVVMWVIFRGKGDIWTGNVATFDFECVIDLLWRKVLLYKFTVKMVRNVANELTLIRVKTCLMKFGITIMHMLASVWVVVNKGMDTVRSSDLGFLAFCGKRLLCQLLYYLLWICGKHFHL